MYVITTSGIAMLGNSPARDKDLLLSAPPDALVSVPVEAARGVLYEGCFTLEDAMARVAARMTWSRELEQIIFPLMAQIDQANAFAELAAARQIVWQRSRVEIERIIADIDAGRVPDPPGQGIEPPSVARYADLVVSTAQRMFLVSWSAEVMTQWQGIVDNLRRHAQESARLAALAAATAREATQAALLLQGIVENEASRIGQPPTMHPILHDGVQVLDIPCYTIGCGEGRKVIWTN